MQVVSSLWVIQDQHIETAQAELALFLENPYAENTAASWEVADQKRPNFITHAQFTQSD